MDESLNEWIGKALDGEVEGSMKDVAMISIGDQVHHIYENGKPLMEDRVGPRRVSITQAAQLFATSGGRVKNPRFTFHPLESITRPPRERLHLITATMWADRSVCSRMRVGAVICSADLRQILSFGYNGPARGLSHSNCSGDQGGCGCLHAEANAVASMSFSPGAVAFVTHQPCSTCAQLLIQAQVQRVVYAHTYRDESGVQLLAQAGLEVKHYPL